MPGSETAGATAKELQKSAFMLAWREKTIQKYKEALACAEEENRILSAYLRCLMLTREGCGGVIRIPKEEIARRIAGRGFTAYEQDGFYVIKERDEAST